MRWTIEQEEILFEHGHRGVVYCRDLIHETFGISRSIEATQRHASRIGAQLMQYEVCPSCGKPYRSHKKIVGLCDACNYERLWRKHVDEQAKIIRELQEGGDADAAKEARRKYDAQRRKNHRLRQEGSYGDFVDLSSEMSTRRSEATFREKKFAKGPKKTRRARA